MGKIRYFYKVVSVEKDKLFSYAVNSWDNYPELKAKYNVEYQVGEWVTPKVSNSKLMVFKTLKDARAFTFNSPYIVIYRCIVKNPRKAKNIAVIISSVENFWKNQKVYGSAPPENTYFCDAVCLLYRVQPLPVPDNKTYYKVVSKNLTSARFGNVEYKKGQWAYPLTKEYPNSKLMVFDNLEDAKNFHYHYSEYIYECKVANPTTPEHGVCTATFYIRDFWNKSGSGYMYFTKNIPGTIFADAVMLTKKVRL